MHPELDYCSWAEMMLYDWCGSDIPDVSIIKDLKFKPIVLDYRDGKRRVVSNISLDYSGDMKKFGEIIVLKNDNSFVNDIPSLYVKNTGSPLLYCSSFNHYLGVTFLELEGEEVWYYEEDTEF